MTDLCVVIPAELLAAPPVDPVAVCLDAVMVASGKLVSATISSHDVAALRASLAEATSAHASALARRAELATALAPASLEEIRDEGRRLLHAWPQDRRGDLAGYGAELGIFMRERRPSRRGLQQACRTLKLTRIHPPAIAEAMSAIDQAEAALQLRARCIVELPDRIARAEAKLAPKPHRHVSAGLNERTKS